MDSEGWMDTLGDNVLGLSPGIIPGTRLGVSVS